MPVRSQPLEPLCDRLRGKVGTVVGPYAFFAVHFHDVDTRRTSPIGSLHARLVTSRIKVQEPCAEHVLLLEDALGKRQNGRMAAEVRIEPHVKRPYFLRAHPCFVLFVDRNVGAAERVNGLLRIADRAQALLPLSYQVGNHVDLQLIRVLEFVHHDKLEPVSVCRRHIGMLAECAQNSAEQAVQVERPPFAQTLLVALLHFAC